MVCDESIALQLVMHWADALLRALSGAIRLPLPLIPPKVHGQTHRITPLMHKSTCVASEGHGCDCMGMLATINALR